MKKSLFIIAISVSLLGLAGCGGGSSNGTSATAQADTQTPVVSTVNLSAFKGVFNGTSTDSQYNFASLTGTDSQDRAWSGSYTMVADGATTFETKNVFKSRIIATMKLGSGAPVSAVSSYYNLASDGSIYKQTDGSGTVSVPVTQFAIPGTPKVGDTGIIGTFNKSDGTTESVTWSLNADVNGTSQFVITFVEKSGSTLTSTETNTFYLDATGNPTKYSVSVTSNGNTINLSGNRS